MSKKVKKKRFIKSEIISNIPSMTDFETGGLIVTFHGHDGSVRYMKCRTGFFKKNSGKRLTSGEIVMKINTYTHDFGAKYFTIQ